MSRIFRSVALMIALTAAPGAHAQRLTAEPVLETAPAAPPLLLTAPPSLVRDALFKPNSGVGVSTRTYTQQDGSIANQRGLVGKLPITQGLEAAVGLFSVAGDGRKPHSEFKRGWSVKEMDPKRENIAAVGMRLRF